MIIYVVCAFVGLIIVNINEIKMHGRNNFKIFIINFLGMNGALHVKAIVSKTVYKFPAFYGMQMLPCQSYPLCSNCLNNIW
jgi:hypothetical protein